MITALEADVTRGRQISLAAGGGVDWAALTDAPRDRITPPLMRASSPALMITRLDWPGPGRAPR